MFSILTSVYLMLNLKILPEKYEKFSRGRKTLNKQRNKRTKEGKEPNSENTLMTFKNLLIQNPIYSIFQLQTRYKASFT